MVARASSLHHSDACLQLRTRFCSMSVSTERGKSLVQAEDCSCLRNCGVTASNREWKTIGDDNNNDNENNNIDCFGFKRLTLWDC